MKLLYPIHMSAEDRFPLPQPLPSSGPAAVLEAVCILNGLFGQMPDIITLEGGRTTTLLYRNVAYLWRDIAESVGGLLASSEGRQVRCFGTCQQRQTVELTCYRQGDTLVVRRSSPSGREFEYLEGLGVQVEWQDEVLARQMGLLLGAVPVGQPYCGAVDSQLRELLTECRLLLPGEGRLFAYFAWEQVEPAILLSSLSCHQKTALWRAFLEDGLDCMEFTWLWEQYYGNQPLFLLEWELALRMVLEELAFQVERDEGYFRITDRAGLQRRFDFARGTAAEKVFLKLLFPLDTKE